MTAAAFSDRPADAPLEWRPIPGWPEYEASECGDVRRIKGGKGTRAGYIRSPWINKQTGYLQVCLWRNNRGMKTTVHRLVALAFLGELNRPGFGGGLVI